MFATILIYVFVAMCAFVPPRQNNVPQLGAYVRIATAIARATNSPFMGTLLASIGSFESGFRPQAVGKLGEVGVWQLLGPPLGAPVPKGLDAQAKEALRRIEAQGMCGYTGEAANPRSECPLAQHRLDRAKQWMADHPFPAEESRSIASAP